MNLTGNTISSTYNNLIVINNGNITNGTGSNINLLNVTASNAISASIITTLNLIPSGSLYGYYPSQGFGTASLNVIVGHTYFYSPTDNTGTWELMYSGSTVDNPGDGIDTSGENLLGFVNSNYTQQIFTAVQNKVYLIDLNGSPYPAPVTDKLYDITNALFIGQFEGNLIGSANGTFNGTFTGDGTGLTNIQGLSLPSRIPNGLFSIGQSALSNYPTYVPNGTMDNINNMFIALNGSSVGNGATGDSCLVICNFSTSSQNSGAGVSLCKHYTDGTIQDPVGCAFNHVPYNRTKQLIPGNAMMVFNSDSLNLKGMAVCSPAIGGFDSGNYSIQYNDFINKLFRIPYWSTASFQPTDLGWTDTLTISPVTRVSSFYGNINISGSVTNSGSFAIASSGSGFQIKEGNNAKMGTGSLNGTSSVVINNTSVSSKSRIFLTIQQPALLPPGSPYIYSVSNGTSFAVRSTLNNDTSSFVYMIMDAF